MALYAAVSRAKAMSRAFSPVLRCMSNVPENTVYGTQSPDQRVTVTRLKQKHKKGEPITMVTAYDYPSAVHLDSAGIDICLVGDSAAMVVHGHDTTLPITLDEMLVHFRVMARGAKRPLLVGDLPFGFYQSSSNQVGSLSMGGSSFIIYGLFINFKGGQRSKEAERLLRPPSTTKPMKYGWWGRRNGVGDEIKGWGRRNGEEIGRERERES